MNLLLPLKIVLSQIDLCNLNINLHLQCLLTCPSTLLLHTYIGSLLLSPSQLHTICLHDFSVDQITLFYSTHDCTIVPLHNCSGFITTTIKTRSQESQNVPNFLCWHHFRGFWNMVITFNWANFSLCVPNQNKWKELSFLQRLVHLVQKWSVFKIFSL
jgi:hypothetical protein